MRECYLNLNTQINNQINNLQILIHILDIKLQIQFSDKSPREFYKRSKMKALKQTVLLGIFFLLLVTTYNSFSFIVTYMYEHKKQGFKQMGPVLLFVNYFVFLVTNSFAPYVKMSLTKQMKLAAFCYTFNYLTEIPQFQGFLGILLSVIGAAVGGYGAAFLWVCYGAYMKTLCKMNNEEQLQGRYFSILNGITFTSLLLGSVVTTFCIQLFSDQIYFTILAIIGAISFVFCFLFIKQVPHRKFSKQNHHWFTQLVKSLKFYKKMKAIVPTLIFDGLVLGFISTSSTNLMPKNSQRIQIGIFLIILGAGCILGGFLSGQLSDYLKMKNAGNLAIMIVLVTALITSAFNPYLNDSKYIGFSLGFLWGISREYIQGWLYVACSRNYNGRLQSYANMKQLHSLSFCLYQVLAIATKLQIQTIYFMLIFIILSPLCFYFLSGLPEPDPSDQTLSGLRISDLDPNKNPQQNLEQIKNEGQHINEDGTISLESSSGDDS